MQPLRDVGDYIRAGVAVISHCSAQPSEHNHVVNLSASDPTTPIDFDWKAAEVCPQCGAAGGGVTLRLGKAPNNPRQTE
jgi:hypothetical protein